MQALLSIVFICLLFVSSAYAKAPSGSIPLQETTIADSSSDVPKIDFERELFDAKSGNPKAQFTIGYHFFREVGGNSGKSQGVHWFVQAAKQGHADSQYTLGRCYLTGDGVTKDYKKAIVWLKKAAAQKQVSAELLLSSCYVAGLGTPKDARQGIHTLTHHAERGNLDAQSLLGTCYIYGKSTFKNIPLGYAWLQLASHQGVPKAKELFSQLTAALTSEEIQAGELQTVQLLNYLDKKFKK